MCIRDSCCAGFAYCQYFSLEDCAVVPKSVTQSSSFSLVSFHEDNSKAAFVTHFAAISVASQVWSGDVVALIQAGSVHVVELPVTLLYYHEVIVVLGQGWDPVSYASDVE